MIDPNRGRDQYGDMIEYEPDWDQWVKGYTQEKDMRGEYDHLNRFPLPPPDGSMRVVPEETSTLWEWNSFLYYRLFVWGGGIVPVERVGISPTSWVFTANNGLRTKSHTVDKISGPHLS